MPQSTKRRTAPAKLGRVWRVAKNPKLQRVYLAISLSALLASCLYWAYLGARVQQTNADQLVSSFLFNNLATFHGAYISGQHTFLLKWPLFLLVELFGYSTGIFVGLTMGLVALTVGLFAFVLYRIERRPLIFGTICLALAATLTAIPPEPVAGTLLPVNMAMLTTRNIEYIFYIISLGLLVTASRPLIRSKRLWLSVAILSVLVASDRLFLSLSIGGAVLFVAAYTVAKRWDMARLGMEWLATGFVSSCIGVGTVWLLGLTHAINIVSGGGVSPYGLISNFRDLAHGLAYIPMDIATDFGANPAYSSVIFKDVPGAFFKNLWSPTVLAYLINIAVLVAVIFIVLKLLFISLQQPTKKRKNRPATRFMLTLFLTWSAIEATIAFVATNHYYPVDSRYLTIVFFTGFVALATYTSVKKWTKAELKIAGYGGILTVGLIAGSFLAHQYYSQDLQAQAIPNGHNSLVASALEAHPVKLLVGNYWRVVPIKQMTDNSSQSIVPMSGCTTESAVQTSTTWRVNLKQNSFAFLLSLSGGPADFPACSLNQIITAYGRPNASVPIAGTITKPREVLLYYDHGADYVPIKKKPTKQQLSTVLPIPISEISPPVCNDKITVMNIVAHEDDDLLFMNPDLQHEIQAGDCIRTVYVTAGDAGNGQLYWLKRQQGSEAAYNTMLSISATWTERIVQLADGEFITLANPIGHPNIGLIFMHLPDGNLNGQGFKADNFQSIQQLFQGKLYQLETVDRTSSYTSAELINGLAAIMGRYKPSIIQTQAPVNLSPIYTDHSDHITTGEFTQKAYEQYLATDQRPATLSYYVGYPIRARAVNVMGINLSEKEAAFFSYATFDNSTCNTIQGCDELGGDFAYGFYLQREYQYH